MERSDGWWLEAQRAVRFTSVLSHPLTFIGGVRPTGMPSFGLQSDPPGGRAQAAGSADFALLCAWGVLWAPGSGW